MDELVVVLRRMGKCEDGRDAYLYIIILYGADEKL
jgi:hypothetical protein